MNASGQGIMVMVAMMKSGNVQLQQIGATKKKNKFGNLAFIFCQNNTLLYRPLILIYLIVII